MILIKRKNVFILMIIAFIINNPIIAKARDEEDVNDDVSMIYEELQVDKFDESLKQISPDFSVKRIVTAIINNDKDYIIDSIRTCVNVSLSKEKKRIKIS